MNQSPKDSPNTVDAVVDDIIAEMPLDDKVRTANLDEDGVLKLLEDCIKQSGNETLGEAEAALYILKELWNRLAESHRLRAVK